MKVTYYVGNKCEYCGSKAVEGRVLEVFNNICKDIML